jgi:hypothetical protein
MTKWTRSSSGTPSRKSGGRSIGVWRSMLTKRAGMREHIKAQRAGTSATSDKLLPA